MLLVFFALLVSLAVFGIGLVVLWRRNQALLRTYAPIIDADAEVEAARSQAQQLRTDAAREVQQLHQQRDGLAKEYAESYALYQRLRDEIAKVEEEVEAVSVGLYKPHFDYDSSEKYRQALEEARAQQKQAVKDGRAAVCAQTWKIGDDVRAGARMTKQYLKLVLRAFNGECDAAIAKVSWNNVTKMEERIRRAYEAINSLGSVMQMSITKEYLDLKLAELRLEYETEQKKQEEKDEQRRIKEQMREEERALREAEKARQQAEQDEARYQEALAKAREEMAQATGHSLEMLQRKIDQLDAALHKAQEMREKATSMAQLTRSGHVYVISNVGSFGDNVFKIGMTRRLEPLDRVRELGDASVPFDFDVHAMIYSEDAPTLENEFQSRFRERAVNLVNPRKEFFSVSIDEIEAAVQERGLQVELTKLAEARDYRETLARRANANSSPAAPGPAEMSGGLPASLPPPSLGATPGA